MKPDNAPGQQKLHTVTDPATGDTKQVTQEQWRNRRNDPSLYGYERAEDDPEEPEPEEPAEGG